MQKYEYGQKCIFFTILINIDNIKISFNSNLLDLKIKKIKLAVFRGKFTLKFSFGE